MKHTLRALDVDLQIEHGGHDLKLTGSGMRFVARFPTLLSTVHFVPIFWSVRKSLTCEAYVRIEWRGLGIAIRVGA
ncbi:MAG: hypothetical protein SGI92_00295 [Bryobacteraceae bacterium]|nr:hypothetical protein [Bryobacteraceae bacterium]